MRLHYLLLFPCFVYCSIWVTVMTKWKNTSILLSHSNSHIQRFHRAYERVILQHRCNPYPQEMLFQIPAAEQSLIAATSCERSAFPPRGQDSDYTSPPRLPQVPFREENYADTHEITEALNNQLSSSPDTHWRRSPMPFSPQEGQSPDSSTSPPGQGSTTCPAEAETPQNPLTSLSRDAK